MARYTERPSQDAIQRLFELTVDMLGTSVDGYFTELNPAWERWLGWTREELMAEPFIAFVHPDDVAATQQRSAVLADPDGDAVVTFENRYRTRSGDYRFLHWTTVAVEGVLYFAAKDVTDRQASETERERAASLSRAITDNVADGLLVAGSDGTIIYANPAAQRMLGYDDDELIGRDCQAGLQADGGFWRKDGSLLPAAFTSSAVPVADGTGRVIVFRDVSTQRAEAAASHEAELLIRNSEALHRTLTGNLPDTTVFLLDHDLRILIADGEAIQSLGYLDANMFHGRKVTELYSEVPEEVLELCLENYNAALQGERRTFELAIEGLTFAVQAVPVRAGDDAVESLLVVARDVTERNHAAQQLARRARQQNAVAALGRFALGSHDLTELMTEAVTAATFTLGVDLGRVLELDEAGERLSMVASVGMDPTFAGMDAIPLSMSESQGAAHTLRTGEPSIVEDLATETRFTPSPTLLQLGVVSSLSVPIEGHDQPFGVLNVNAREPREFSEDEVEFLTAIATLIIVAVERDRGEQVTRHAALHDPLTGLPNRTLAIDRLDQALARRQRERIDIAVFVLDIDGFKLINDSLGHAAGDEVLLALSPRLTDSLRTTDTVARLGGDEFVVICPDIEGALGATDVAKRLAAAITRPLSLDGGEHFFTVSVGGTLAANKHDTPESLLGDADAAMYRAKARGRGGYELFDEAMRTSLMARVRTETELRRALTRGELEVYYQPVIDLATGRPVSTEALVRWQHPERGLIPPLDFIPIAEETGLIALLGLQVLEDACRQTAAWQRDLDPALGVSVNVSGRQALNPLFPEQVAAIAEHSRLRAGTLALEITETVLMEEADSAATVLDSFQAHGLSLVLDDFGTGYSSLSRLKRFPLDVLKIDRSFIAGIESNPDDRAIVKATIDMAHAVGLTVVAEGVETAEQEERLRDFGCDHAQGYLYARPQPAEAITDMLAAASR